MLDIRFIHDNRDLVQKNCDNRNVNCDIDQLLVLDEKRKELLQEVEKLNAEKNKINSLMQKASETDKADLIKQGKSIKDKLERADPGLSEISEEYKKLLYSIPNIHSDDTPIGIDETGNKILRKSGEPPQFDFNAKDHVQLGEELGVIDTERAAKISGSRFSFLKGELALLEFALVQHVFATLTNEETLKEIARKSRLDISTKPFIPVVPPVMIKPDPYQKMARLEPKEERYYISSDDIYLIGSAEHTMGAMHMNEIFSEDELPLRYIGFSTAFRREAGSYGKDMKGILRVHQFDKLEMESFSLPENSLKEQDFIVAIQEYLVGSLGLPYQVVAICTGDMAAPDLRQIDIETWMPGQGKYRETHTSDLNTDYQSRGLNTRVRRRGGEIEFVHMNDATAFAIGRIIIAIVENFQQSDGSVKIPEVLQKYMPGGISEIRPK